MASTKPLSLTAIPAELIQHILQLLPVSALLAVSQVNRLLHEHSLDEQVWKGLIQACTHETLPLKPVKSSSWRKAYIRHHPFWFVPAGKIWFSDSQHTGKVIIARYDHRREVILGHTLVAERQTPEFLHWEYNPEAIIHTFSPKLRLDLAATTLKLDAYAYSQSYGHALLAPGGIGSKLQREVPMNTPGVVGHEGQHVAGIYSNLLLTRALPAEAMTPATRVWPPTIVPSPHRTRNVSSTHFRDLNHRPKTLSELNTSAFRLRRWMEFSWQAGVRIGEEVYTFATLPKECYTPTKEKPFQGIWCGDYAGHGCEFLVIMQPDNPKPLPEQAQWVLNTHDREGSVSSTGTRSAESMDTVSEHNDAANDAVQLLDNDGDELVFQGRIEAIKLTGDPNIPRGEYTWIAPDIGPNGVLRIATEEPFKGARVVRSVGHIAGNGFKDGEFCIGRYLSFLDF